MNNSETRLTEVEMQLMLLQRQVDQLSQELYRSALAQEKLLKRVEELEKQRAESDSTDVVE
jgi:chromosome segregation ATPase